MTRLALLLQLPPNSPRRTVGELAAATPWRRLAPALALAASVSLTTPAAVTAAGWAVEATPHRAGAVSSDFYGVSCSGPKACTAVGSSSNAAGKVVALAERWDGRRWKIQSTPSPARASGSEFQGVRCTEANACIAVGWSSHAGKVVTLAERWDGKRWKIQSTPNPAGRLRYLSGVACAKGVCEAVGHYIKPGGRDVTLAERWDGKHWKIQSTPNPAGASISVLLRVSCTAPKACTAVGNYKSAAGHPLTLAERWDGKRWKIQSTPNPGNFPGLSGVSCTASNACIAVGSYFDPPSAKRLTLAERWDGKHWKIQSTPNRTGSSDDGLGDVSCTAATACTAVGASEGKTLAERWDGTAWKIQSTPNAAGTLSSVFDGVSCAARYACTAVGTSGDASLRDRTLAEGFSG